LTLAGVLVAQVAFILAFGERKPPPPRQVAAVPTLQLSVGRTAVQELEDPTLFARPHRRDFAAGWLNPIPPSFPVFRWTEPTKPLALPEERLGGVLTAFLRSNAETAFTLGSRPAPELLARQPEAVREALPLNSRMTILGDLATRQLLNPPTLPSWPAEDLLTNSVVQLRVDAAGNVLTASLMGAERPNGGSGSAEADNRALTIGRGLKFAPLPGRDWLTSPAASLTRGVLVFQWRTVPATNGPGRGSQP
jgi:hypothetical protein